MKKLLSLVSLALVSTISLKGSERVVTLVLPPMPIILEKAFVQFVTGIYPADLNRKGMGYRYNLQVPQKLACLCDQWGQDEQSGKSLMAGIITDEKGVVVKKNGKPLTLEEIRVGLAAIGDRKAPMCELLRAFLERQEQLAAQ